MKPDHEVIENLSYQIRQSVPNVASSLPQPLRLPLNESFGTFMLWRRSFSSKEIKRISAASQDLTCGILRILHFVGTNVLRLSRVGNQEFVDKICLESLRTSMHNAFILISQKSPVQTHFAENESEDSSSDASEDEVEALFDDLRLRLRLLMRLVPTMERVLIAYGNHQRPIDAEAGTVTSVNERNLIDPLGSSHDSRTVSNTTAYTNVTNVPSSDKKELLNTPAIFVQPHTSVADMKQPETESEVKFYEYVQMLGKVPISFENPGLLDEALTLVPLDRIYAQAEQEHSTSPTQWSYQDAVIKIFVRWFMQEFFQFVTDPRCEFCGEAMTSLGPTVPNDLETARGATKVELYVCTGQCQDSFERFPRYSDVWVLLATRRGRMGEFANCFTMFCRAMGARARWVWCQQDLVWTEVYSEHQRRWVHVDPTEGLWDKPLIYTEGWGRKIAYCIAFSVDGPTDVTSRYVRKPDLQLPRGRVPESVLRWIISEQRKTMRKNYDKNQQLRLKEEDDREQSELQQFARSGMRAALRRSLSPSQASKGSNKSEDSIASDAVAKLSLAGQQESELSSGFKKKSRSGSLSRERSTDSINTN